MAQVYFQYSNTEGVLMDRGGAAVGNQAEACDCADRDSAIAAARDLRAVNPSAMYEIRPVKLYLPGVPFPVTEAGVADKTPVLERRR